MSLDDDLTQAGFELVGSRQGTNRYARRSNPYLQWWVVTNPDGTADLQWEFELGAYLKAKGFHVSVQDELSLLLFPSTDVRGPADQAWIAEEIAQATERLASVDLVSGD